MSQRVRRLGESSDATEWFTKKGRLAPEDQEKVEILEEALRDLWNLGRNLVLQWCPVDRGIQVLVVPHYVLAGNIDVDRTIDDDDDADEARNIFIETILSGKKRVDLDTLEKSAVAFSFATVFIKLPFQAGVALSYDVISEIIKRFGLNHIVDRAVALFDIVGFSLYSPLEQVTQLNSLSYSFNAAHAKMIAKQMDINFARTTTGDGFYVWNRDSSIQANINLYHFMHLVLADNAIANVKSVGNVTPLLRAAFHIGSHYEFYQSEGLNPTTYSYIVGDVTIELARMIDRAVPGQVVVGEFQVPMDNEITGKTIRVDTEHFIQLTEATLSSLEGLVLSGERIDAIRCYLTGDRGQGDSFTIKKYLITDKHGLTRHAYNAKINIYRENADPIFLGIQDQDLTDFAPSTDEIDDAKN